MSFYKNRDFIQLEAKWREKLSQDGFVDIEDKKGNLKSPDRRTIGFQNRERIMEFFIGLDHYLTDHEEIPGLHRAVLELYSQGKYLTEICVAVKRSKTTVKGIISAYKKLVIK